MCLWWFLSRQKYNDSSVGDNKTFLFYSKSNINDASTLLSNTTKNIIPEDKELTNQNNPNMYLMKTNVLPAQDPAEHQAQTPKKPKPDIMITDGSR